MDYNYYASQLQGREREGERVGKEEEGRAWQRLGSLLLSTNKIGKDDGLTSCAELIWPAAAINSNKAATKRSSSSRRRGRRGRGGERKAAAEDPQDEAAVAAKAEAEAKAEGR